MEEILRVLARIVPGPAWLPGKSVYQQGLPIQAHLAFMRTQFDKGTLLIGGPSATGLSGFAVLDVADLGAAKSLALADPGTAAGVLAYEVHEWHPFFDVVSGVRDDGSTPGSARSRREQLA
jgi:uncharacterized protein YciI